MDSELVMQVRNATFRRTRLREGYHIAQVDQFMTRLAIALEMAEPVAGLVDGVRFTPVRLREGYDMGEVDDLIEDVAARSPHPDDRAATRRRAGA